jgi:hypothetical protein
MSLFALRSAARGPAAQGIVFCLLYPALTPSARKRASGACWAIFATRLAALSVGVVCWNARRRLGVIELSKLVKQIGRTDDRT